MATTKKTPTKKKPTTKKPVAKKPAVKKAAPKKAAVKKKVVAKSAPNKDIAAVKAPKSAQTSNVGVFAKLRKWNLGLGVLHAAQAALITALAYDSDATYPLRVSYLEFNQATESLETATRTVADVPLVWFMVVFLGLSALFHFIIAGPWFKDYVRNLKNGENPTRWVEYSLSASVMMVSIAFLTGVVSLGLLISIFAITSVMNLLGWVMERTNDSNSKSIDWLSFNIGCLAGIVPWVVIGLYFASNFFYGTGNPPTFVYAIFFSIFALFNTFAINMYLQYKKIGPWKDYLFGEKVYMILSLVAKSALAWQVFAGALGQNM